MEDFTKNPLVKAIAKGLLYQENGGKPTEAVEGQTGEMKSYFQFTPATWKNYAKEVYGDPNTPLNEDTETYVVMKKVNDWLTDDKKNGYSDSDTIKRIASRWNAGTGEPEAYTGKFGMTTKTHKKGDPTVGLLTGTKGQKVKMDVPTYATNVENYANKFINEDMAGQEQAQPHTQEPQKIATAGSSVLDSLKSLISGSMQHASAMEQPPSPRTTNMPLMQANAPQPEEVKTPNAQNMGLLQKAFAK